MSPINLSNNDGSDGRIRAYVTPGLLFETNFSEYVDGSIKTQGWSNYWNSKQFDIETAVSVVGSKNLISNDGFGHAYVSPDIVGDIGDAEILTLYRSSNTNGTSSTIVIRGSTETYVDNTRSDTGYVCSINNGTEIRVNSFISNSNTILDTTLKSWSANTWYWIRFSVIGNSLKAKFWENGTTEPVNWDIEVTDGSIGGVGRVGVGRYTQSNKDWGYFAVSNGESISLPV